MKKILLFSFLSLYMLAFTEFGQILKIGSMIDHFREHKHLNDNTTFLKFLAEHYVYGDGIDSDDDKDQKLPFKTKNSFTGNISPFLIENYSSVIFYSFSKAVSYTFPKKENLESDYLSAIWQPPRFS